MTQFPGNFVFPIFWRNWGIFGLYFGLWVYVGCSLFQNFANRTKIKFQLFLWYFAQYYIGDIQTDFLYVPTYTHCSTLAKFVFFQDFYIAIKICPYLVVIFFRAEGPSEKGAIFCITKYVHYIIHTYIIDRFSTLYVKLKSANWNSYIYHTKWRVKFRNKSQIFQNIAINIARSFFRSTKNF